MYVLIADIRLQISRINSDVFISLGNAISYVYPLLRNHPNWTLDSDEFRSRTAEDSSIQNLLNSKSIFSIYFF